MNVRFAIDRLLVEGTGLSTIERMRLEAALQVSLQSLLFRRMNSHGLASMISVHSDHEEVAIRWAADAGGAALGRALAPAVEGKVWATALGSRGAR